MDPLWRIEMFGGLRAVLGDHVVSRFRSHKTGALLAYLAFYPHRSHPRDLLIDLLWPEEDLDASRMKLRTALASLRRQLEPPGVPAGAVILANRLSARLNPAAVVTDVAQFEVALQAAAGAQGIAEQVRRLDAATALYRGPLLPGHYEAWVLPEQQRLSERFLQALHRLIAHLERAGDLPRALEYAVRAVAADPLREEARHELIRLYAAAGQPAAARRQYRELERLLREELGESPSATTRALVEGLREGAPTPAAARLAIDSRPATDEGSEKPLDREQVIRSSGHQAISRPLPLPVNRFFGREAEIARVRKLLLGEGVRLATLTGPGGSGKTRLALEVAARLREALDGAVWFVPLADLSDPHRMIDAVHAALALPRLPQAEPLEQVVEALSRRPSLLVLENFEHLMPDGCPIVRDLLERIPMLQCLVTSRQILELTPEREIAVGPLPVPVESGNLRVENPVGIGPPASGTLKAQLSTLNSCESVALFVDRAQRARAHFQLTRGNAAAVAELCRRLDGIPLAVELAAARTRELSPARMLGQIERRLDLLVSRKRDLPSRHQTLRAAVDWSYQLLACELQDLFARLFVFRGGFTAEAAGVVCEVPEQALDYLAALRDSSLVQVEEHAGEVRYRLLETLREYTAEQLTPEDRAQAAQRHAEYYRMWAEAAQPGLRHGPQQKYWLDRMELEHDNLRAALDWAEETEAFERAFQLAATLDGFWVVRGHYAEAQQRLTRLLDRAGATIPEVLRARTLNRVGWLTHRRGAYAAAVPLHEQALEISRRHGDRHGTAVSLRNMGAIAMKEGNSEAACRYLEESLEISQALGDKREAAASMTTLGLVLVHLGHYGRASTLLEQALGLEQELALTQQSGPSFAIAATLDNLAIALLRQGRLDEAQRLYVQSLRLKVEMGNADSVPYSLEGLAQLAAARGQWARTVRLLAAADAAREAVGHPRYPPSVCANFERLLAQFRDALGADAFSAARSEGSAWDAEQRVAYALQEVEAQGHVR